MPISDAPSVSRSTPLREREQRRERACRPSFGELTAIGYTRAVIGSQAVGAWIAQVAFWVLILVGLGYGELARKRAAIFLALWLAGYIGLRFVSYGGLFMTPYVALLDLVLVFMVVKGDVRLG